MLEIHMIDQDEPSVCFLTLEELLRTAHVIGEVPFIKPREGALLNLTAVTRIIEDNGTELTTEEARAALEDEREPEQFGNWGPGQPRPRPLDVTVPRRPPGGSAQRREG